MRAVPLLAGAALVAASGPLLAAHGALLGGAFLVGGLLAAGHGVGDAFFPGYRPRSKAVARALAEAAEKARPTRAWPTLDPRHPRLREAWRALRAPQRF